MAVILADGLYTVRKRPHSYPRDSHGTAVPSPLGAPVGPVPGCATGRSDGTWSLRLDPRVWPLREDDQVTGPDGTIWVVAGRPVLYRNSATNDVDYIGVAAVLDPPLVE